MKSTKNFSGTHVADSKRLNDYSKMKLSDMTIVPFQNPNNFDYESLYSNNTDIDEESQIKEIK